MNSINLELKIYANENYLILEDIKFENIAFITIKVDDIELLTENVLGLGFFVFDEFEKSSKRDGLFLIFTSVVGVADEGGWDYVHVKHEENYVYWNFKRDNHFFSYVFNKNEYLMNCKNIQKQMKKIKPDLKIEPSNIVFPE